jgi:DNA-binding transcriptional ArsR family regulator
MKVHLNQGGRLARSGSSPASPSRSVSRSAPPASRWRSSKGEPLTVGEFVQALRLRQPTVSYHLKLLRDVGLLEREARATSALYRLAPAAFERIAALLALPSALAGREPAGASASEARVAGRRPQTGAVGPLERYAKGFRPSSPAGETGSAYRAQRRVALPDPDIGG